MRLAFRPKARADLIAIDAWIAADSPQRADAMIARIRKRCDLLLAAPLQGRPREELAPQLRSVLEPPYSIFYRVTEGEVEIVRVLHGARNLSALIQRDRD